MKKNQTEQKNRRKALSHILSIQKQDKEYKKIDKKDIGPSKDKIIIDVAIRIWQEIWNKQRYLEVFVRMMTEGRQ